ncbi:hypothetical protein [Spongiimicrobium sp. 3-5]|uniref:hypothetical protein n=1 Tax=Spongiimicrobium sp. 3-5 TaxID=3332596 RepID=UPI00397FE7C7
MKRDGHCYIVITAMALPLLFLIASCAAPTTNFKREYRKIWKETIKSEAWFNSLQNTKENDLAEDISLYSSTADEVVPLEEEMPTSTKNILFLEKYHFLVSRAYFKIIAQAENADDRLRETYERLKLEKQQGFKKNTKDLKGDLALATKRYHAHREMLEGLRSWNIFSPNRSNDLDFFKEENTKEVFTMWLDGETDDTIINFLVYKLADLYHFNSEAKN